MLLGILMACPPRDGVVGFMDDWRKVRHGQGITEIQKFVGVALGLNRRRRCLSPARSTTHFFLSARFAYPPYSEQTGLGYALQHVRFAWPIFFLLITTLVRQHAPAGSGLLRRDGWPAGGSMLSASLAFSVILFFNQGGLALTGRLRWSRWQLPGRRWATYRSTGRRRGARAAGTEAPRAAHHGR